MIITAGSLGAGALPSMFPRGIPIGTVTSESDNDINPFQQHPAAAVRRLLVAPVGDRARSEALMDGAKAAARSSSSRRSSRSSVLTEYPPFRHREHRARRRCSRSRCCAARSSARSRASAPACCSTPRRSARSASRRCCSPSPASGSGATARRPRATASTRRTSRSPSSPSSTPSAQLLLQFVLGEPAPGRRSSLDGLPLALLLNLLLTAARCTRSSRRLFPPRRARRPRPRGAAPWLAPNAPGGRFLPGDPRVEEPYRLTPQLAFRVAILGFLALARLRGALPAALGAAGALRRPLPRAGERQPRADAAASRRRAAPILDRNGHVLVTQRRRARASSCGRPTCRRTGRPSARSCGRCRWSPASASATCSTSLREHAATR